jgi:hypothetical protein
VPDPPLDPRHRPLLVDDDAELAADVDADSLPVRMTARSGKARISQARDRHVLPQQPVALV